MRPIFGYGGGNTTGALANNANPRPVLVLRRSYMESRLGVTVVGATGPPAGGNRPSNPGFASGMAPVNATFKDSSGRQSWMQLGRPIGAKLWTQPFTGPQVIQLLKPRLRGISHQVTNHDVRTKLPGYTYSLPININTPIGRAMRRPYMHTGA
jgi:hypothetical protein